MSEKKRKAALDAALRASFLRLEGRPIPEHLKVVIDQLEDPDEPRPSPSRSRSPEP
jgi:hypothetical protein